MASTPASGATGRTVRQSVVKPPSARMTASATVPRSWVSSASSNSKPEPGLARPPARSRGRAAGWAARPGSRRGPRRPPTSSSPAPTSRTRLRSAGSTAARRDVELDQRRGRATSTPCGRPRRRPRAASGRAGRRPSCREVGGRPRAATDRAIVSSAARSAAGRGRRTGARRRAAAWTTVASASTSTGTPSRVVARDCERHLVRCRRASSHEPLDQRQPPGQAGTAPGAPRRRGSTASPLAARDHACAPDDQPAAPPGRGRDRGGTYVRSVMPPSLRGASGRAEWGPPPICVGAVDRTTVRG